MGNDLVKRKCTACVGGVTPLRGEALRPFFMQLGKGWEIMFEHHLEKTFTFKNFQKALDFANIVGAIAEEEGHHPDLFLSWGVLKVHVWTHKIDGLSDNDFILAAKIEAESISHSG